ncbi:MAG TPA: PRC-barrel domain-containing protein [Candidatus Poseidoniales archaeon]|nr:PRC-barrel domain-containing protein [Candidatus Poseidoniales archaeon]
MPPITFSKDLLGRNVLDAASDVLGTLENIELDMSTGHILSLCVKAAPDIDVEVLPWPTGAAGVVLVPLEAVERVTSAIHLNV